MKYNDCADFSPEMMADVGIAFIKRELAKRIIAKIPIEHLDVLFNFEITLCTERITPENWYKHELIEMLSGKGVHRIEATIETKFNP